MQSEKPKVQRLVALDAFRGATIALMVLVNDPGDGRHVYGPLNHSDWNGWTITDAVFPSFLWIVGVAITLSLSRRLEQGATRGQLARQALRRALILFALGLFLYGFPHFHLATQRYLGVLQRISIGYFVAALLFLYTGIRGQIAWIIGLFAAYWLLMTLVPVPGFGPGRLDVEGNFAHYVDRIVLGAHNYRHTKTWDPEGIISTLPAIGTALLGIMAGHLIRVKRELAVRTAWMFAIGNVLIFAGLICDFWLPINKKLWTDSFALFMGGLDFVLLALFIWLIDHMGYQRYVRPLIVIGMNAIAVYMLSELLDVTLSVLNWHEAIYDRVFVPIASPYNASLLYAIAYTLFCWAFAYILYWRKWFLKV